MKEVISILNQIASTTSRNEKEDIIRNNKGNSLFKAVLYRAFNPFLVYGIGDKKLKKFIKTETEHSEYNSLIDLLDYLEKHNTGSDATVKIVARFINSQNEEDKKIYTDIILKKLKIGVTSKTINKALNEKLIPEFSVQLAKKYEDEDHKIKGDFGVTLKLDGIRVLAVKDDAVKFFTRQGQPILELVELEEEFKKLPDNMVYDGELVLANENNLSSDDLFRATQKVVRKDGVKRNVEFHMFDLLSLEEFQNGKSKFSYHRRMLDLHEGLDLQGSKSIKKVPILYWGSDKSRIYELLDKVTSEGKEGLMVNDENGYYETKRTDKLLKVKKMQTVDLRVIDTEEGTGKNEGRLGALIVDYKGYPCGLGSGFSDAQRVEFWEIRDELIGKIVEVSYFEESTNESGGLSLRFPVFKGIRDDKSEPSYY